MAPLIFDGAGTISGLQAGGLPDSSVTSADIANGAVTAAKIGYAGAILQVVSALKTDTFSTASTTFADVTGLSVSITPSSTNSKILVFVSLYGGLTGTNKRYAWKVIRGSTDIAIGDTAGNRTRASGGGSTVNASTGSTWHHGVTVLDSPSSTSALTYKVQGAAIDGDSFIVNYTITDTDASTLFRAVSSITAMEVAG